MATPAKELALSHPGIVLKRPLKIKKSFKVEIDRFHRRVSLCNCILAKQGRVLAEKVETPNGSCCVSIDPYFTRAVQNDLNKF